jgi:tryptophan synthase beta chain|tara:strand:- start:125 stop:1483 length:1359 start_codon:yes stop_codon:yes gene_type:complete
MNEQYKFLLKENDMPKEWYNIIPDLPILLPPPLSPQTMEPIGPEDLAPLFPMGLILQEVSQDSYIGIPQPVLDLYKLYRPSPLFRAIRLEKALGTKSRIYYKYEGGSPSGSHKPNTAIPQAFYNSEEGVKKIVTETGAGQWGSAMAFACQAFGIELEVFQVAASYLSKPYRKTMMEIYGATVHSSPSERTDIGKKFLSEDPESPGSLGIAISEAIEVAVKDAETRYALGSVLNHVLMHQTIIGLESLKQLELAEDYPDIIVGCTGGGSNFAGLFTPFARENIKNGKKTIIRAVEPEACPSLTKGKYTYDFGDSVGMAPVVKMHTLGHTFVPDPIHAGGLRYHGMAPLVSAMYEEKLIEAEAIGQKECFEAGQLFAKTEGIVPAPEATHAIASAIRAVKDADQNSKEIAVLTAVCGHGHFDMVAYSDFLSGQMIDYEFPAEKVKTSQEAIVEI